MRKPTLRPLLAGTSALLLCWGPAVRAQDQAPPQNVPLSFGFSQSFQALSNPDFKNPSNGDAYWSITSISFGSSTVTPTDTLQFSAGVGIGVQRHPNGDIDTSINTPYLSLDYGRTTQSSALTLYGNYILETLDQLASPSDFINDNGEIILPSNPADLTSTGLKQDITAGGSLELGRDARFGLRLYAAGQQIVYSETTDDSLLDMDEATAGLTGIFNYSSQGDLTLGVSASHQVTLTNPGTVTRDTQELTLGTNYDVSPVLSLGGFVQYEVVQETNEAETRNPRVQVSADYTLPDGSLSFQLGDQDTSIVYQKNMPTGSFTANLSHGLDDSGNGTLDQVGLNYSRAINDVSGLNMGLFYSADNGSTTSPDVTSSVLVISYNHQLTKDWGVNIGANYRLRDPASDAADTATSAGLFLTISRNVIALR